MPKQILFPFFFLLFSHLLAAQTVTFSSKWKFKTGDDDAWKEQGFNDSDRQSVRVPVYWETVGFPDYDGSSHWKTVRIKGRFRW